MISIDSWHLWVILGVTLMGLEMLGMSFVALAVGVSCLVGALVAYGGESLAAQIGATVVTAAILTPLFVRSYRRLNRGEAPTGLAGEAHGREQRAILVSREGRLGVVITGDFFPAEAVEGESPGGLQEGVRVQIESFSGITALVRVVSSEEG